MNIDEQIQELCQENKTIEAMDLLERNKSSIDTGHYYSLKGMILSVMGEYEDSISYLLNARDYDENRIWLNSQLAFCYNRLNRHNKALGFLIEAKEDGRYDLWLVRELAYTYSSLGRYEEAIANFEDAIKEDANDQWTNVQYSYCLNQLGQFSKALPILKKALEQEPMSDFILRECAYCASNCDDVETLDHCLEALEKMDANDEWFHEEMGRKLERNGDYNGALAHYKLISDKHPDNLHALSLTARVYYLMGEYDESLMVLNQMQAVEKDTVWCLCQMGKCYEFKEDPQQALDCYERAMQQGRNDGWIYYNIANCCSDLKRYEEAIRYLEKGYEQEPSIEIGCSLAWNLGRLNRYEEALKYLEKAKSEGRDDNWINIELGYDYSETGQVEKAIECYEKVEITDDNREWMLRQLGWNYGADRQYQKALDALLELEQLAANDAWIKAQIAWNYTRLKKPQEAMAYYQKAETMGVKEAWLLKERCYCLHDLRDFEAELSWCDQILEDVGLDFVLYRKAEAYSQLERYEEALTCLEQLLDKDAEHYDARALRAWIYDRQDRYELALADLEKMLDMGRNDDSWLLREIGWNKEAVHDFDTAMEYYEKAKQLQPEPWIDVHIAYCLARKNHPLKAMKLINAVKKTGYDSPWFKGVQAYCLSLTLRKSQGKKLYEEAMKEGLDDSFFTQYFEKL